MKYYLVVFLTVTLISVGILLLKNPFFLFANASADLLNSLLESKKAEPNKQKHLIDSLGNLLPRLGILLLFLAMTLGVSLIPVAVYLEYNPDTSVRDLDKRSFYFFLSVILGLVALFAVPIANRNKESDSTGWSMLLHRMILQNYNISRSLLNLEKRLYRKKIAAADQDFVIVSGLASAGGTAMVRLLFESKKFHTLSLNNMPFLLSVNLWRKRPRKNRVREKGHKDNTLFGYRSLEALEEYFFKVFLNDSYITGQILKEHEVNQSTYEDYMVYQKLIGIKSEGTSYLAKSNNLILRYQSLRAHNPDFKIILIFRKPVEQACSLLKQHDRFCDMHEADPFTLEYMNWMGHHEYGLNHKVFDLEHRELMIGYRDSSINYWLAIWISYYSHVLSLLEDPNLFLVDYDDLCSQADKLLSVLSEKLNLDLRSASPADPYDLIEDSDQEINANLLERAEAIYHKLLEKKLKPA